jgi:hypothetical protein
MKFLLLLLCSILCCGCSVLNPYNEEFLCQGKTSNGKCADMGQAYQDVQHADNSLVITDTKEVTSLSASEKKYLSAMLESQTQRIQDSRVPVIKRPELLRMLMLEYTDDDVLFGNRYIWFLNDKPEWVVPSLEGNRP